jgi:hypothetical protein
MTQGKLGGFSLHQMVPAVDRGAVFSRHEVTDGQGCGKNYWNYLNRSTAREASVVREFLLQASTAKALPEPMHFENSQSLYFKTPSRAEIQTWRKAGWRL